MDDQKKPRAREKRVVEGGKGVEKKGQGLGTGPLNNMGNYEDRREQQAAQQQAAPRQDVNSSRPGTGTQRPASSGSVNQQRPANSFNQQRPAGSPFGQQRPADPFSQQRPSQQFGQQRPAGNQYGNQQRTGSSTPSHGVKQNSAYGGGTRQTSSPQRSSGGGLGKLLPVILAFVVIFVVAKSCGLFGSEDTAGSGISSVISTVTGGNETSGTGSSGSSLTSLLSTLLGSDSSVYDFSSIGQIFDSTAQTSSSSAQYFTSSLDDNTEEPDLSVSTKAREKFTAIRGNNKDTVTVMVYMCGADLESQQGMATADLKEMASAKFGSNVRLIVFTGGCTRWRNNVVSSSVNQIYEIRDGAFERVEADMGSDSMTKPATLTAFLKYGKEHYPADRMCLIFWDHGGGSISGYGYDERYGHGQSMTLAGINQALKDAGMTFDFIGFDTCLMATVENGIMLSQYADYMIASEESEPGVGWYYTNWLNKLGKNTSIPTVELGKIIVDDFVEVCNQQCRGQATTLSVVDLAELQATVPEELRSFSVSTNEMIQQNEYKTVSTARSKTREFAQQSRIDQIDLIHFARNMGTSEGKKLAKALEGAVKYNRTGGGISNAYGLSIYFPYKQTGKVSQIVSTYEAIGMDEEYTRCIQEFASLEVGGQVAAGTPVTYYGGSSTALPGLMNSLLGGGSSSYSSSYSGDSLSDLMGSLFSGSAFGGSGSSSLMDLFSGRTLTAQKAAEYIRENHFDSSALVWNNGSITLSKDQWSLVQNLRVNVFFSDGSGFIDLGTDNLYTIEGDSLISDFDGTWISIDGQPVAYYYMDTIESGDDYVISGYVPAQLNGMLVKLILNFDSERPEGYIAGAVPFYQDEESMTQGKMLISIGKGDKVQFLCDYFDYDGNYRDSYMLGDPIVLGDTVEIANTAIDSSACRVTYCFTDIYQQRYWTPPAP